MDAGRRESLALIGKTLLVVVGGVLAVGALVDLAVAGWRTRSALFLLAGVAMFAPPMALAFRDAARAGRRQD